jgi:hypothetical protein
MLMVDSPPDRSFSPWHRQCWVRIPGKHQSYDTAFDVAESCQTDERAIWIAVSLAMAELGSPGGPGNTQKVRLGR